jgi:hypothetical protein
MTINNLFLHKDPFISEGGGNDKNTNYIHNVQISEATHEIYNQFNDPSTNKRIWTKEEDQILLNFMKQTNNSRNWKKISETLKTKTPQQCTYRYNKLVEEMTKRKWTRTEDIKLIELIEVHGNNWELIASMYEGRTAKDVEDRFVKKLDPNLKKSRFTDEEDEKLIKLHEKYGNQWFEISKNFKNRTVLMIKNRFYSFLRRKLIKDNLQLYNSSNNASETLSNNNFSIGNEALSYSGNGDYTYNNLNNSVSLNKPNNRIFQSSSFEANPKRNSTKNPIFEVKQKSFILEEEEFVNPKTYITKKEIEHPSEDAFFNQEVDFESFLKSK